MKARKDRADDGHHSREGHGHSDQRIDQVVRCEVCAEEVDDVCSMTAKLCEMKASESDNSMNDVAMNQ
jgi:hypothetical protein